LAAEPPSDWEYNSNSGRVPVFRSLAACNSQYSSGCSSEEWCSVTRYTSPRIQNEMVAEWKDGRTVTIYYRGSSTVECSEKK
jgi:hypothetical protein